MKYRTEIILNNYLRKNTGKIHHFKEKDHQKNLREIKSDQDKK